METRDRVQWYPFTEHAVSDSCWSLSTGPDGRIYAAACAEGVPGGYAKVIRYDEATDALEYLLDVDAAVEDPRDSGRLTQCKIHYSFAPSFSDGIMYFATHLSAPPHDEPLKAAWKYIADEKRMFRGSAIAAYDTTTDEVLWWDTLLPGEGCRAMVLDEDRGVVYAISCPRDQLVSYDLATRERTVLGRIGSVNSQALLLDSRHRVWTASDRGELVRYDPEIGRIERSNVVMPYDQSFQTGWHSLIYDAVASPDGQSIFASTYSARPQLVRLWLDEGEWGRVEPLGPATQERSPQIGMDPMIDHCGGLVFGGDGQLYYVATRWTDPSRGIETASGRLVEGVLWRLDPETHERHEEVVLEGPGEPVHYVARAAIDHNGDLFFAYIAAPPAGIFKVNMPAAARAAAGSLPKRVWG